MEPDFDFMDRYGCLIAIGLSLAMWTIIIILLGVAAALVRRAIGG